MKGLMIGLVLGLSAWNAQAGEVTGLSELTLRLDHFGGTSGGVYLLHEDGKLRGGSTFDVEFVRLDYEVNGNGSRIYGWGPTGHVDLQCNLGHCEGRIQSGRTDVDVTTTANGDLEFKGVVNSYPIRGKATSSEIRIQCDGNIELNRVSSGRFRGQGVLSTDPRGSFRATLNAEGTLADLREPALLLVQFAAPICRPTW